MAGGGLVAGGVLLIVAGLIVPGIPAQQTIVQAGGYQVTQTTYPYQGLGVALFWLGVILLPIGFVVMGVSASGKSRAERERVQERQQLYDTVARATPSTYAPPPVAVPQVQTPAPTPHPVEFRFFCPTCGQRLNSEFCPDDATKTKPVGGQTS